MPVRDRETVPRCNVWPTTDSGAQTFFTPSDRPATVANRDGATRLVLGTRFTTTVPGLITDMRFFQSLEEGNTAHVGRIHDASTGRLLASVPIPRKDCRGPGWVSVGLPEPLSTVAHTEYMVSVDDVLHYPKDADFFPANGKDGLTHGHLRMISGAYGFSSGHMPATSTNPSNYWLDGTWGCKRRVAPPDCFWS